MNVKLQVYIALIIVIVAADFSEASTIRRHKKNHNNHSSNSSSTAHKRNKQINYTHRTNVIHESDSDKQNDHSQREQINRSIQKRNQSHNNLENYHNYPHHNEPHTYRVQYAQNENHHRNIEIEGFTDGFAEGFRVAFRLNRRIFKKSTSTEIAEITAEPNLIATTATTTTATVTTTTTATATTTTSNTCINSKKENSPILDQLPQQAEIESSTINTTYELSTINSSANGLTVASLLKSLITEIEKDNSQNQVQEQQKIAVECLTAPTESLPYAIQTTDGYKAHIPLIY